MTLRLILTRHAKSGWDDPTLSDHERGLTDRGRNAARAIGTWLADQGYLPDQVLSSDSTRTRETWDRMQSALGNTSDIHWLPQLYLANAPTLLQCLRHAKGDCVLMISHNPGIADFAEQILRNTPQHSRFADYPTAATLVADFNIPNWRAVGFSTATMCDFIIPKDL